MMKHVEEMVAVPKGPFLMGERVGDDAKDNEVPQRTVCLSPFLIRRYPVTVSEWWNFVRDSGYLCEAHSIGSGKHVSAAEGTHPITKVSWYDADAFAGWYSLKKGQRFRLPTEAQWEKACRGVDGRRYPWGNDFRSALQFEPDELLNPHPVGYLPENVSAYGCADMNCNVCEWCRDWYSEEWYYREPNPGWNPEGPRLQDLASGNLPALKVIRGGQLIGPQRCAFRCGKLPDVGEEGIGFRLVVQGEGEKGTRA
jgi:sulfatase modifying factor 1